MLSMEPIAKKTGLASPERALAKAVAERERHREVLRGLRREILRKAERIRKDLEGEIRRTAPSPPRPFVAVDSAFHAEQYDFAAEYRLAAVAVLDAGEGGAWREGGVWLRSLPDTALEASVDMDAGMASQRLLEGLGLSLEAALARKAVGEVPNAVVHLDGSFSTFIIKLNALLTLVVPFLDEALRRGEGGLRLRLLRKAFWQGVVGVEALADLLEKHRQVAAWAKGFGVNPFVETHRLRERYGLPQEVGDALLLDLVLEPGEWVAVQPPPRPYNLPKPRPGLHPEADRGLERVASGAERILEALRKTHVVYLKGQAGKLHKMESPLPLSPDPFYPFTITREIAPLALADKRAREFLRLLSAPGEDLPYYRERAWRRG